ncbi:ABC transporter substrate-binding protein [Methanofervidicoccus abyssi]|uniref:Iron complex transport system substrate-binding protein n=1 Tax=Methanofervidicoccus abyssi TaxID=2082189 RepID=A0A401HPX8_9EURY|nr:ABC transporter substrate-binding protein [Methanofervidicoccus abyssi]GBF36273.1 iron complex transport system substrate-binding protein [Methanofervidicoccus abyssi]
MSKSINIGPRIILNAIFLLLVLILITPVFAEGNYNYRFGDVNEDGKIDITDVVYLFKHRNISLEDGDLNCDDKIDITDVVYLFKNYNELKKPIKYAQHMNLTYYDKNGNVVNPYEGDSWAYKIFVDATGQRFLLKNESEPIPEWAKGKYDIVINVPLKNVVVMSSTEIALMMPLNDSESVISSIKGIMWGGGYKWYFEEINRSLENGSIIDVGSTYNPNWDKIVNISPQVIFVYPGYDGDAIIEKCKELGITYVADAEYLEPTCLGRCEWVKMFAAFYNKEDVAKRYFTRVEKRSFDVKRKTYNCDPNVLVAWGENYPKWGGTYVPEAQSYVATEITDFCHASYIFSDYPGTGSATIDYETFAERAKNADVWIVPSSTTWLSTFKEDHPGYETFKAVKNGRLFCESDDYWQLGLMNTDEVLMDLGTIIHPEAFKGRTTHFFLKYNPDTNTAKPYTAE